MIHVGWGYGKTILLGEHFVVHGLPALVAALELKTVASLQINNFGDIILMDHRPKAPGFQETKQDLYYDLVCRVFDYMGIIQRNYTVTLAGDLPVTSGGVGASAAAAVAIARAVNNAFGMNCDEHEINQAAYHGECSVHGMPSGIDNTAAVFGGLFLYQSKKRRPLSRREFIPLVIADSGVSTDTKQVIEYVKNLKTSDPAKVARIFCAYEQLVDQGVSAVQALDLIRLGQVMTHNHQLLQELGVSCPTLDRMVEVSIQAGALGAKMTGTGQGGVMVALAPHLGAQEQIAKNLQAQGFFVIKTRI
jgi:mevalonate kinase